MSKAFIDALKARRSHYALTSASPISDAQITSIVNDIMLHVPSSFNNQSVRALVLLGAAHKRFWGATRDIQVANEPDEARKERVGKRVEGFLNAYGTVAFFENASTIKQSQTNIPAYAHLFPEWSQHSQGMHQLAVWTALDAEGFGANLQHYQFDAASVAQWRKDFTIAEDWVPYAQLVFGGRADASAPPAKEKLPLEETVRVVAE